MHPIKQVHRIQEMLIKACRKVLSESCSIKMHTFTLTLSLLNNPN